MAKPVTNCPNPNYNSLDCQMIPKSIKALVNDEVLFCKNYKFVIAANKCKEKWF